MSRRPSDTVTWHLPEAVPEEGRERGAGGAQRFFGVISLLFGTGVGLRLDSLERLRKAGERPTDIGPTRPYRAILFRQSSPFGLWQTNLNNRCFTADNAPENGSSQPTYGMSMVAAPA